MLTSLTTFQNRLSRTPYIKRMLIAHILLFISLILLMLIMGPNSIHYQTHPTRTMALAIIPALLMAITFIIGASALVRRLHDLNYKGYWALLILPLSLIPLLTPLAIIILAMFPGNPAPNRFNQPE